jgi:hypothetical protein
MFFTDASESTTYKEALEVMDAASLQLGMESKMNSIRTIKTWELVELLQNRKALPCKWVYRLKQVSDSSSTKHKVRIVAKVFRQGYGVNFDEVFSPFIKMTTLHFLLGVVALEELEFL